MCMCMWKKRSKAKKKTKLITDSQPTQHCDAKRAELCRKPGLNAVPNDTRLNKPSRGCVQVLHCVSNMDTQVIIWTWREDRHAQTYTRPNLVSSVMKLTWLVNSEDYLLTNSSALEKRGAGDFRSVDRPDVHITRDHHPGWSRAQHTQPSRAECYNTHRHINRLRSKTTIKLKLCSMKEIEQKAASLNASRARLKRHHRQTRNVFTPPFLQ